MQWHFHFVIMSCAYNKFLFICRDFKIPPKFESGPLFGLNIDQSVSNILGSHRKESQEESVVHKEISFQIWYCLPCMWHTYGIISMAESLLAPSKPLFKIAIS